jgi:hypothetical protein
MPAMAEEQEATIMLTTTDVAGRLGFSEEHVRRLCEAGRFDGAPASGVPGAFRLGLGCHWRIPQAAVDHFLASTRPKVSRRDPRPR